jgi:hypothetical protein
MNRRWTLLPVAVLLAGCSSSGAVQCGGCPGPNYSQSGLPARLTAEKVVVCPGTAPCTTTYRVRDLTTNAVSRRIVTPSGSGPESYVGAPITVSVQDRNGSTWQGTGTLSYVDEPEPCGCDGLSADVTFRPDSAFQR